MLIRIILPWARNIIEDFETISKAIEGELEADVKRLQQEKGSLEERLHRLEFEVDTWKVSLDTKGFRLYSANSGACFSISQEREGTYSIIYDNQ